jgi:hypothetical protein
MEPQYTSETQTVNKPPKSKLAWFLVILLLIASIAGFGLWYLSKQQLTKEKTAHSSIQKQLDETALKLNQAQVNLKMATFLPDLSNTSPECGSGNNDKIRLTPVNKDPIDGYRLYLLSCLNQIDNKTSLMGELQAYKVKDDGQETFDFGNDFGEPYCISTKLLPAKTACSGYYGT